MRRVLFLLLCAGFSVLLASSAASAAPGEEVLTVTAEKLNQPGGLGLPQWRYLPGDESSRARPDFDDSAWVSFDNQEVAREWLGPNRWTGLGWFRIRFQIEEELQGVPIAFWVIRLGASEIYLDGLLLYRASTGSVEEVLLKGMPLGAFLNFRYEQAEFDLAAGDALLLMSDGFPELFNPGREILGYDRTRELFEESAGECPKMIIDHLTRKGEEWAESEPQDDDMTFVILRAKTL